jgi:hypothetical protein
MCRREHGAVHVPITRYTVQKACVLQSIFVWTWCVCRGLQYKYLLKKLVLKFAKIQWNVRCCLPRVSYVYYNVLQLAVSRPRNFSRGAP